MPYCAPNIAEGRDIRSGGQMKKHTLAILASTLIVGAIAAPAAQAKVPLGKYRCYQTVYSSGMLVENYMGGFKLKAHHKYVNIRGKGRGKYEVKGQKVIFKTGPYHTFTGKAGTASDGTPDIVITLKSNHAITQSCFHK
jgi:hypothetical protein